MTEREVEVLAIRLIRERFAKAKIIFDFDTIREYDYLAEFVGGNTEKDYEFHFDKSYLKHLKKLEVVNVIYHEMAHALQWEEYSRSRCMGIDAHGARWKYWMNRIGGQDLLPVYYKTCWMYDFFYDPE